MAGYAPQYAAAYTAAQQQQLAMMGGAFAGPQATYMGPVWGQPMAQPMPGVFIAPPMYQTGPVTPIPPTGPARFLPTESPQTTAPPAFNSTAIEHSDPGHMCQICRKTGGSNTAHDFIRPNELFKHAAFHAAEESQTCDIRDVYLEAFPDAAPPPQDAALYAQPTPLPSTATAGLDSSVNSVYSVASSVPPRAVPPKPAAGLPPPAKPVRGKKRDKASAAGNDSIVEVEPKGSEPKKSTQMAGTPIARPGPPPVPATPARVPLPPPTPQSVRSVGADEFDVASNASGFGQGRGSTPLPAEKNRPTRKAAAMAAKNLRVELPEEEELDEDGEEILRDADDSDDSRDEYEDGDDSDPEMLNESGDSDEEGINIGSDDEEPPPPPPPVRKARPTPPSPRSRTAGNPHSYSRARLFRGVNKGIKYPGEIVRLLMRRMDSYAKAEKPMACAAEGCARTFNFRRFYWQSGAVFDHLLYHYDSFIFCELCPRSRIKSTQLKSHYGKRHPDVVVPRFFYNLKAQLPALRSLVDECIPKLADEDESASKEVALVEEVDLPTLSDEERPAVDATILLNSTVVPANDSFFEPSVASLLAEKRRKEAAAAAAATAAAAAAVAAKNSFLGGVDSKAPKLDAALEKVVKELTASVKCKFPACKAQPVEPTPMRLLNHMRMHMPSAKQTFFHCLLCNRHAHAPPVHWADQHRRSPSSVFASIRDDRGAMEEELLGLLLQCYPATPDPWTPAAEGLVELLSIAVDAKGSIPCEGVKASGDACPFMFKKGVEPKNWKTHIVWHLRTSESGETLAEMIGICAAQADLVTGDADASGSSGGFQPGEDSD